MECLNLKVCLARCCLETVLQVRINAHLKCFRSSHKHVRSVHESQPEAFQVDLDVNQKECLTLSCVRVHLV